VDTAGDYADRRGSGARLGTDSRLKLLITTIIQALAPERVVYAGTASKSLVI
jgi:hypothetical protein